MSRDLNRRINEVTLPDHHWQSKHWRTLEQLYGKAPFFDRYREFLAGIYLGRQWDRLSDLNQTLIRWVAGELGIAYATICVVDNLANGVGGAPLAVEDFEAGKALNRARLLEGLGALIDELAGAPAR